MGKGGKTQVLGRAGDKAKDKSMGRVEEGDRFWYHLYTQIFVLQYWI